MVIAMLQDVAIEDKMNNAPDSSYEIGLFIGSMLPFIVLVAIAYLVFRYNKKKFNSEE